MWGYAKKRGRKGRYSGKTEYHEKNEMEAENPSSTCFSHCSYAVINVAINFHVQIYYAVIIALFFADVSSHYYIFVGISSI